MAEDRSPTGIVAKRLTQSQFICPMAQVARIDLVAGATWRSPSRASWILVHVVRGRLDGLPVRASALLPASVGLCPAGGGTIRCYVAAVGFQHPQVGDPLLALAMPVILGGRQADAGRWASAVGAATAATHGAGWQRICGRGLVLALLGDLLADAAARGRLRRSQRAAPVWLSAALTLAERRLGHPDLAVRDLAVAAGLGLSAFSHGFRLATGSTPWGHVLERRLLRAEGLLRSGYAVKTVAARCGFTSAPRLITAFRRRRGRSPLAWLAAAARDGDVG